MPVESLDSQEAVICVSEHSPYTRSKQKGQQRRGKDNQEERKALVSQKEIKMDRVRITEYGLP
jgi:hypothetical protein